MATESSDMYGRVEWMVAGDEAILRLLASPKPLELSPGDIAHNTGYTSGYVQDRVRVLVEKGLVDRKELEGKNSRYGVTDLGQRVADQDATPDELAAL